MANIDLDLLNKKLTRNQEFMLDLLAKNENKEVRAIGKEYRTLFEKIDRDLKALYGKLEAGKISFEEAQKYNRLDSLLDRTKKSMDEFYRALNKGLNKINVTTAQTSLFGFAWTVENAAGIDLAFNLPNKLAIEIAKNTPFYELAKNKLYNDGIRQVRSILNQGFMQGQSYIKSSKDLQKVLGGNYKQAERIVRTETHRIYEQAHNEEFLQTQKIGIETYMMLISVIDGVTRQQSLEMNSQKSNAEGKFKYPNGEYYIPGSTGNPAWDIHDREVSIQVLDGFEPKGQYVKEEGKVLTQKEIEKLIAEKLQV